MAGYGPPGDFNNQPTQRAGFADAGPPHLSDSPEPTGRYAALESPQPELAPTPWYRRRAVVIAWGLLVAILIVLIIYGLIDLVGRGGGAPTPTYTITNTPTTTTTTTAPTTTATTPSTTTTEPPPSNEPPAATAPPAVPPAGPPPQTLPPRRPHHVPRLPKLPSTITVPGIPTVITLPPGL